MKKEAAANLNRIEREDMTLLRAPGYIYDLLFVFATYFNAEDMANNLNDESNQRKDDFLEFLKSEVRPYFGDIPDDLYIFFHSLEHGRCFVSSKYFKAASLKDINFENFCASLSDKETLVRNIIKFYFHTLDEETVETLAASKEKIFPFIKKSAYSAEEKAKLYEFFLDPDHYVELFFKQLKEKEKLLAKYYADNSAAVTELFDNTTLEAFAEQTKELYTEDFCKAENTKYYFSVCILNKNLVLYMGKDNDIFFIVGSEYKESIESIKLGKKPDLKGFGCVLAEESRVKILAYMLKNGEATCKDLEKNFSFSGTTAYHHVTMMARVGIVKSHVVKKTVYYSINKNYVDKVLKVLLDYSNYKDINEVK